METRDVLSDGFGRVRDVVRASVDGLTDDELAYRIDGRSNSIAWLVWHLSRVQDDHVADVAGAEQVWTEGDWVDRFGPPFEPGDTGYGHSDAQVAAVRASCELLAGYHEAVCSRTLQYLAGLAGSAFDRVVDEAWDPPVTLGVRLVSVLSDDLQHAGQAAFVRGLLDSG